MTKADITAKLTKVKDSAGKKQSIFALLTVLIPLWLIGLFGFLFAYPSFRLIDGHRQWVGDIDGLLMTLLLSLLIVAIWIFCISTNKIEAVITRGKEILDCIKAKPGRVLRHIIILALIPIVSFIANFIMHDAAITTNFFLSRVVFFATTGLCVYSFVLFRKSPEKLFLSLSLLIGFMYVFMHPSWFYAWDQQIHYAWSIEASFVRYVSVSEAEIGNVYGGGRIGLTGRFPYEYANVALHSYRVGTSAISRIDYNVLSGVINDELFKLIIDDEVEVLLYAAPPLFNRLAHIPAGIMIFIARSLTLPANITLLFGLIGNHLAFTLIVYFAIKRLITGKYIMAVIAMFPTVFVLSTTVGYDYWLIALVMLGTAYFIRELQEPDKKIETKSLIIMLASLTLAMGPKAVYFPLMLILYFIKRNKFSTKKGYMAYMASVSVAVLFVVGTFMIPFIATGGGGEGGDPRGGAYVEMGSQTMFILQNPLTYANTLLYWTRRYLGMHTMRFSSTFFALMQPRSYASYFFIPWLLLFFVTITDRSDNDALSSTIKNKILMTLFSFAALSLTATSMYILFTNVGAGYISGMQPRYILPILFPFAAIVGGFKINNNINKTAYTCIIFGIMCFMLLNSAWEMFVPTA